MNTKTFITHIMMLTLVLLWIGLEPAWLAPCVASTVALIVDLLMRERKKVTNRERMQRELLWNMVNRIEMEKAEQAQRASGSSS